MGHTLLLGAVAYDPKVVTIWDGFRVFFAKHGLDFDYVLYSNYERQVQALLDGHVDIGWNTNLAWLKVCHRTGNRCRALAMRDVDAEFKSVFVARRDSGIEVPSLSLRP